MQFFRPPSGQHAFRTPLRATAVLSCALLVATSVSACSSAQRLTTGLKVRNSVVKLGDQPASTVVVSVDGSPRQAREFLTARAGGGKRHASMQAARMLSRAELTVSAGTDDEETPLKEMPESDAANVAAALNFGGNDVAAVKSVKDELYLRVNLRTLAKYTADSEETREAASEIVDLADELPHTMGAARDALKGKWVRADPEAFDDFARVAETLAERRQNKSDQRSREDQEDAEGDKADARGKEDKSTHKRTEESEEARRSREIRDAVTIGSALDGQSQREFISGVQDLLREHAEFEATGEFRGAERVRMTLPGRKAARDLVAALRPLGAEIDPARVPGSDIVADLAIRRGQLTSLTLDLGQFTRGEAHLPLRLEFSGGDAVSVTAPGGAKELMPQDLVATAMYGALGTEKF
ncbi:hypothetical protein [Streptomyces sp. WMMB 322]|uniref:hypothetical protein n=1 Tax=Streptomyces sp. WMMB 322 TaxID=1286821 RepID=UPI000823DF3B|nr:hypothetical protein [Streptomyces sp. WMMB 322]SCK51482.1 hypothetical protein H180DRAFT_04660 [Streptomyces sp. WMMB 322]